MKLDLDDLERKARNTMGMPDRRSAGDVVMARDVALALIARIRELAYDGLRNENREQGRRIAKLEAIAKAATAFVDEQGKMAVVGEQRTFALQDASDFAGGEFGALVAAVEGAGR